MNLDASTLARFWAKVDKRGPDECWPWTAARNSGYGVLRAPNPNRLLRAHVASFLLHGGTLPQGMYVLHSCDNTWCVNPFHLRAGTAKENSQDASMRGRLGPRSPLKGTEVHTCKLSPSDVEAIRDASLNGAYHADLARQYGVSDSSLSDAVTGKSWKHLAGASAGAKNIKGIRHPMAKLDDAKVMAIRSRFKGRPCRAQVEILAEEFGVSISNIYVILSRRSWKHL